MAQLNIEIPEDLHKRLRRIAVEKDLSIRILVTAAVTELIEDLEQELAQAK
jgi:predicted transcriptional regulator